MEKRFKKIALLMLALPMIFIGCQKSELVDNPSKNPTNDGNDPSLKNTIVYCGNTTVASIVEYSNPTFSFGTVTVGNDMNNLYVTYQANTGNNFTRTHLYVGPEALLPGVGIGGGTGTLYPGEFPYQTIHPYPYVQTFTYTIPLTELENCFVVAAHSIVKIPGGAVKSVWALYTPTASMGFYFGYCKQACPPPPVLECETAYAFGDTYANCFLYIPGVNSNNWGWSNGPVGAGTYSWPLYAGAGRCDISKGTLVGNLEVNYTPPVATVTWVMIDGFVLNETHLFVGNQILPIKNNKFTTAPGQFPYKHEGLNGVITDSYTIDGLSGLIYIAAHSEACGYY